jgi:pimeloyl-ACP methyl ester carboxylesterase
MPAAVKKPRVPRGIAACASRLLALVALGAPAAHAAAPGPTAAAGAPVAAGAPAAPLRFHACELEHPLRLTLLAAECAVLSVPENPHAPGGRRIDLSVVRVPAISRRKAPDPLFVLAGGPGQAAGSFYAATAGAFGRILRERDIVLVDQRGTGRSNPLDCPAEVQDQQESASPQVIAASTRACLASLAARADVAWYTTSVAVEDLESVRAALGAPRIDLYGASYGTRVAQQYLRRYPQHTRALILDGVVPVGRAVGADTALVAEAALLDILARCAKDAPCRAAFGDPAQDYRTVRAAVSGRALPVKLADPASGVATQREFGTEALASVLRLSTYASEYAALLPLMLHAAAARADYAPLAAQQLLFERAYAGELATGMHNSVVCAEDVPFFDEQSLDRAQLAATYLGTLQLEGLKTVCRIWPHGPVDADLHAPLTSQVPALLLSGSDDPVTPPAWGAQALRSFPAGVGVVLEGFGHGQLTAPCVDRLMAQFLQRASVQGLEVGCTRLARPMPFFTSLNGPPP